MPIFSSSRPSPLAFPRFFTPPRHPHCAMSLEFRVVCALFECLSQPCSNNQLTRDDAIVRTWFEEHDSKLPRRGTGGIALLSCVFPERRPDGVYGVGEKRLG